MHEAHGLQVGHICYSKPRMIHCRKCSAALLNYDIHILYSISSCVYVQQDVFIPAGRNWDISWLCFSSENSLPWALAFPWTLQILLCSWAGWCSNTQGNACANFLDYWFVSCRNPQSWSPVANCRSPGFPELWFCLLELARWPNSVFCVVKQWGDCLQAGSLSGFRAFLEHFFFLLPWHQGHTLSSNVRTQRLQIFYQAFSLFMAEDTPAPYYYRMQSSRSPPLAIKNNKHFHM